MHDPFTAFLEVLIDGVVKGSLLAGIVWCVLQAFPRLNATTRYVVWYMTLIAVALMPALVNVPVPVSSAPPAAAAPALAVAPAPAAVPVAAPATPREAAPAAPPAAPIIPAKRTITLPGVWFDVLSIVSAFVIPILLFRLLVSLLFGIWLKRKAEAAPPAELSRFAELLREAGTRRKVRLLVSSSITTPIALGFRRPAVVVPLSLAGRLTEAEFDQLARHEIAHLCRRDDWSNLGQQLITAVLYFHPVVHWLGWRLDLEREIACDDWVIAKTGRSRPYAACLTRLIELTRFGRRPLLSTGAIGRKQIVRRIEALLDATRNAKPTLSRISMSLVALLVLMLVLQLSRIERLFAVSGSSNYRISDGSLSLEVSRDGQIEFTGDERDVKSISDGGFLRLEQRQGWISRRVQITPGTGGELDRRYFVGGQPRPFDGEAKSFLASQIAHLARESGQNVPQRVSRILEERGAAGLLDDIGQIGSDSSRGKHIAAFVHSGKAEPDQLKRAMRLCGEMHSDAEKSRVLEQLAPAYFEGGMRHVLFAATGSMHSDEERRKTLTGYLETDGANPETLEQVLTSSTGMHSDSQRASVLLAAIAHYAPDSGIRRAFFESLDGINSDSERRRVMTAMLERADVDESTLSSLLRSASRIHSDNEKASVLVAVAKRGERGVPVRHSFYETLDTLQSDSEKKRAASAVLEREGDPVRLDRLLESVREMHSDHEKTQLLLGAAARYQPEIRKPFFEAVVSVNSDSERRKVLGALLEQHKQLDSETVVELVQCAAKMPSDHEKTAVLGAVAERFASEPPIRSALVAAADTVHSNDDYRKLMRALVR